MLQRYHCVVLALVMAATSGCNNDESAADSATAKDIKVGAPDSAGGMPGRSRIRPAATLTSGTRGARPARRPPVKRG